MSSTLEVATLSQAAEAQKTSRTELQRAYVCQRAYGDRSSLPFGQVRAKNRWAQLTLRAIGAEMSTAVVQ